MTWLVALLIVLALSWLIQAALAMRFHFVVRGWRVPLIDDAVAPPAVVVLCLRGGDPFLVQCIDGLLSQDYPSYRVRFVVDSEHDPAVPIVRETLTRHKFNCGEVLVLTDPLPTCSLKCSSLAQALSDVGTDSSLDQTGAFVALLDADTIPHRSWLRELATGLQPADVGAVTGNRWYMPDSLSLGALTRHIWNAAAIVQMYFYNIAWGGTLAIKLDSIKRANLLTWWTQALCEDTMTHTRLTAIGQRVVFVPALMMVNREDVTLARLTPWIRRQLLTTRLYHPHWNLVLLHGISSAVLLLWGWGMSLLSLLQSNWAMAISCALIMYVYQTALNSLLPIISRPIESIVRSRGEETNWADGLTGRRLLQAVCVTQWVYTWALVSCIFVRKVEWRGIEYQVDGPGRIRMLGYRPYQLTTVDHIESL